MYRLYMTEKQADLLRTACASMIKLYSGDIDAILEDVAAAYGVSQATLLTAKETLAEFSDGSRHSLWRLLDDYTHIMLGKFSRISDILLTDNTQCCAVQQGLQQLRSCLVPSLDLSVASTDACWQAKLSYEMVKVLEENRRSSKPTMIRVTKEPLMLVETI